MLHLLMRLAGRRPSPALVVSVIALVVASAGTATAAKVLITSSKQIKAGSVTSSDISNGSVSRSDVRKGAIGPDQLNSTVRSGLGGGGGPKATEVFRRSGPSNVKQGVVQRVATLKGLAPGVYAIFAKATLNTLTPPSFVLEPGDSASVHCVLDAGGETDDARHLSAAPGASAPGTLNLQLTRTLGAPTDIELNCDGSTYPWSASDASIIALRVSDAPRTAVDG